MPRSVPIAGEDVIQGVERFVSAVEDVSLAGVPLLRRLRVDLADLIYLGLHYDYAGQARGEYPRIIFDTEDAGEAVFDELARRLPPQLYWSDLLPLTWETVGDAGVRQLATLVSEAYGHAKFASLLWSATDDDATRRYDWDSTFGIFIAPRALRALVITHEVVRDLEMHAHLE